MKTLNKSGIESGAKYLTFLSVLVLAFLPVNLQADTVWESGHHEIFEGNVYGEIWMYNDCTLDIFGGDIYRLAAYDTTITDWYDGQMDSLWTFDNSIVSIYGGELDILSPAGDSSVYLYAYNVIQHSTGGYYDYGWIEGKYLSNDSYFSFDFARPETLSHINIVPEPATLLLLALGVLGVIRRK